MTNIIDTDRQQDYPTVSDESNFINGQETPTSELQDKNTTQTTENINNFSRTVPHGALHAEREEHKKTKIALSQLRDQHEKILTELNQNKDNIEQETNQENQLWQAWEHAVATTRPTLPDLDDALHFLASQRERQLNALGQIDPYWADQHNRTQQMNQELRDLVHVSLNKGENPAKVLHKLAQSFGFGSTEHSTKFKDLNDAQKAARTLASSNGQEAGDPLLLESLANLSEAEFSRWYEANPDSFRRLFSS